MGSLGEIHPDKSDDQKQLLYTYKNINVKTNNYQIIYVNLTQENPKPLVTEKTLELTYSVNWVATNVNFARRFELYLDYPFFEHQINKKS